MLIHLQNLYALRSKRRTGRREAQSREPGPHTKNPLCITDNQAFKDVVCEYVINWFRPAQAGTE
jgi:hypothetical protein